MKKIVWAVLLMTVLALTACQLSPSQMLDRMPLEGQTLSHVKKTIEGELIKLNIDIDVTEYPDKAFGVYDARPLKVDHDAWFDYFFPGIDRSEISNVFPDSYFETHEYKDQEFTMKSLRESFYYDNYGVGRESGYYKFRDDDITTQYSRIASWFYYGIGAPFHIAENNENTANEADIQQAESLSDAFMDFIAKDQLVRTSCDIAQKKKDGKVIYVTRYDRLIEGLPLFIDHYDWMYEHEKPIDAESFEICVMDGEVVRAMGFIRETEKRESFPIIALEQALNILTLNVDTVSAFTQDYIDGITEKSEFDINKIELAYYPVLIEDAELLKSFAGRRAYATYRPAWCIASGERSGNTDVFVMVIDAITGEVIG